MSVASFPLDPKAPETETVNTADLAIVTAVMLERGTHAELGYSAEKDDELAEGDWHDKVVDRLFAAEDRMAEADFEGAQRRLVQTASLIVAQIAALGRKSAAPSIGASAEAPHA